MPMYEYKGKSLAGAALTGVIRAKDRRELERVLRRNKIMVTSVRKKSAEINIKIGTGVRKIDISRFTRQFSTMIGAGLPMVQCLDILSKQMDNKIFAKIIKEVKESVSGGTTLSEALARHPKIFDPLYTNMVQAGELGGALDVILTRLAAYREKADALTRKVKGALIYPSVIVIVAIGVVFAMLTWIVPVFAGMFGNLGAELPEPTQIVLAISDFLQAYVVYIMVGVIGFVAGIIFWGKTSRGRLVLDTILINSPIFRQLVRKSSIARFPRWAHYFPPVCRFLKRSRSQRKRQVTR